MVKVAFVTDGIFPLSIGGIQKYSLELLRELNAYQDLQVTVLHPHQQKLFEDCENIIEEVIPYPTAKVPYIIKCWLYTRNVSDYLLKNPNYDIVYVQGLTVWNRINLIQAKIISNFHGLEPFQALGFVNKLKTLPLKLAISYVIRNSDITINEGGLLGELINQLSLKNTKIEKIPNAVHLNVGIKKSVKNKNKEGVNFLTISRIAQNKGLPILLKAFANFQKQYPNLKLKLHIAGDGPMRKQLQNQYQNNHIVFYGRVSEEQKENLLKSADAFVFPTLFEGMPTVILEAMAYGLPIIATKVGGIPDLVDKTNGFLISKNSVTQLENTLIDYFFLETAKKEKLSGNSLLKVKNYSWEVVGRKHLGLFKSMFKA